MFLPNDMTAEEKTVAAAIARQVRESWPEPITEANEASIRMRAMEMAGEAIWADRSEAIAAERLPWWLEESETGYPPRWVLMDEEVLSEHPEPVIDLPRLLSGGEPEKVFGRPVFSRLTVREWEESGRVMPPPDPMDFIVEEAVLGNGGVVRYERTREQIEEQMLSDRISAVADMLDLAWQGKAHPQAPEGLRCVNREEDIYELPGMAPMSRSEMSNHLHETLEGHLLPAYHLGPS